MIRDGTSLENLSGVETRGTSGRAGSFAANAFGTAKGPAVRSRGIAAAIVAAIAATYEERETRKVSEARRVGYTCRVDIGACDIRAPLTGGQEAAAGEVRIVVRGR
jgi:hypothetical protein